MERTGRPCIKPLQSMKGFLRNNYDPHTIILLVHRIWRVYVSCVGFEANPLGDFGRCFQDHFESDESSDQARKFRAKCRIFARRHLLAVRILTLACCLYTSNSTVQLYLVARFVHLCNIRSAKRQRVLMLKHRFSRYVRLTGVLRVLFKLVGKANPLCR